MDNWIDIACSPLYFRGNGAARIQTVLRACVRGFHIVKFVVHDRYVYTELGDDGKPMRPAYGNGDYFTQAGSGHEMAQKAIARWSERCAELAVYNLASVADLTATAIRNDS